ncbi:MAG: BREX-1 system phosphatase PglZ type B, partial [Syntrophobacteraceae bacterium]
MIVCQGIIQKIRGAALHNSDIQVAPECILWPDKDRQWEAIIPRLKNEMQELLVLGGYVTEDRTGPAIWLRCAMARKIEEVVFPPDLIPVLYLPGVSRQDLRAVENCPEHLKAIVELQYRGTIWSQLNAKDWTILAFLKSDQGGLGLDVAQDNDTRKAMQLALYRLMDEEVDLLKGKRLEKDYFNTLLTGGDPIRDLLQWMDQGDAFKASRGENEWTAFIDICKSQLAFNPETDGVLAGASKLASRKGAWQPVWERFCEAPRKYPNIPKQIRKCKMPPTDLYSNADSHGGWPQWNDMQEIGLRQAQINLKNLAPHNARKEILRLEKIHGERRGLVWSELGESPLALALKHLTSLAEVTAGSLAVGDISDMVAIYKSSGWVADDAVIKSLACVNRECDREAVGSAIRSVYSAWLEDAAIHLQKIVRRSGYPGGNSSQTKKSGGKAGECLLFIDGMRLDTGKRLGDILSNKGFSVEEMFDWAALPSVTATGKPAVTPVKQLIAGKETAADFEPCISKTGQSLKGGHHLRKLMVDSGVQVLEKSETGDAKGKAWCEWGNIDSEGHDHGSKLARLIEPILSGIAERIEQLLDAGWKSIRIVTDHGWLLLPGGLPKVDLPAPLIDTKWGRCAAIKPGAITNERLYPWFWNPTQSFALADGVSCYKNGLEYTHGGLSLQECLVPELVVTRVGKNRPRQIELTDIKWKQQRCTVAIVGDSSGLSLDIRTQPADASSSIVMGQKPFKENGLSSVVVENEELRESQ